MNSRALDKRMRQRIVETFFGYRHVVSLRVFAVPPVIAFPDPGIPGLVETGSIAGAYWHREHEDGTRTIYRYVDWDEDHPTVDAYPNLVFDGEPGLGNKSMTQAMDACEAAHGVKIVDNEDARGIIAVMRERWRWKNRIHGDLASSWPEFTARHRRVRNAAATSHIIPDGEDVILAYVFKVRTIRDRKRGAVAISRFVKWLEREGIRTRLKFN